MNYSDRVKCESWDYVYDMGHTIVTDWNLVCDRQDFSWRKTNNIKNVF